VSAIEDAWLGALAAVSGGTGRLVSSKDVAAELARTSPGGRITSEAAAKSLARLAQKGLAVHVHVRGRTFWRLSEQGRRTTGILDELEMINDVAQSGRLARLEEFVSAFNRRDEGRIADLVSSDIVMHVPGINAIAGTFVGRGQTTAAMRKVSQYVLPDLRTVQGSEDPEEARILAQGRTVTPSGSLPSFDLWLRARFGSDGRIADLRVQPEDQAAYDRAIGR
jgi:hypothetical protein